MLASRVVGVVSIPLLLALGGCGFMGMGGSAPPPAAAPVVESPAHSSPPVLQLATTPQTPQTPEDDGTASLLAEKIAKYTKQLGTPRPAANPAPPTTLPNNEDGVMNLLSADSLRLAPYDPAAEPLVGRPSPGNGDIAVGTPDSIDIRPGGSSDGAWTHRINQRVHDYPRDLEGQLDYELLSFLQDRAVPDMGTIAALPPEDREVLASIMDGLSNFRNGVRSDPNMLMSRKIAPLVEMTDRLKEQAELTIPTVALCTSVSSFGVYSPVKDAKFQAGRDNEVIVYCEVQNFASRMNTDGLWETKLNLETVLYTEEGEPVWPVNRDIQSVTDLCRNRRHDFFVRRKITLPGNLSIQRYLMKVTVTDEEVNRIAEATTPVEMVTTVDEEGNQ